MEIQIYIIIAFSIINFICSLWIGKIQKTRIEGLESMLKEQKGSLDMIKTLSDLKDVEEFKKYTDLRIENIKMEKEKLIKTVSDLTEKVNKYEKDFLIAREEALKQSTEQYEKLKLRLIELLKNIKHNS